MRLRLNIPGLTREPHPAATPTGQLLQSLSDLTLRGKAVVAGLAALSGLFVLGLLVVLLNPNLFSVPVSPTIAPASSSTPGGPSQPPDGTASPTPAGSLAPSASPDPSHNPGTGNVPPDSIQLSLMHNNARIATGDLLGVLPVRFPDGYAPLPQDVCAWQISGPEGTYWTSGPDRSYGYCGQWTFNLPDLGRGEYVIGLREDAYASDYGPTQPRPPIGSVSVEYRLSPDNGGVTGEWQFSNLPIAWPQMLASSDPTRNRFVVVRTYPQPLGSGSFDSPEVVLFGGIADTYVVPISDQSQTFRYVECNPVDPRYCVGFTLTLGPGPATPTIDEPTPSPSAPLTPSPSTRPRPSSTP